MQKLTPHALRNTTKGTLSDTRVEQTTKLSHMQGTLARSGNFSQTRMMIRVVRTLDPRKISKHHNEKPNHKNTRPENPSNRHIHMYKND